MLWLATSGRLRPPGELAAEQGEERAQGRGSSVAGSQLARGSRRRSSVRSIAATPSGATTPGLRRRATRCAIRMAHRAPDGVRAARVSACSPVASAQDLPRRRRHRQDAADRYRTDLERPAAAACGPLEAVTAVVEQGNGRKDVAGRAAGHRGMRPGRCSPSNNFPVAPESAQAGGIERLPRPRQKNVLFVAHFREGGFRGRGAAGGCGGVPATGMPRGGSGRVPSPAAPDPVRFLTLVPCCAPATSMTSQRRGRPESAGG
jgi:hypothetical protein